MHSACTYVWCFRGASLHEIEGETRALCKVVFGADTKQATLRDLVGWLERTGEKYLIVP